MLTAMDYVESLLDLVGNTPLVRLHGTLDLPDGKAERGPLVLAKVEYLNPGGSVKDRIATRMIDAAEASGELQPGGTTIRAFDQVDTYHNLAVILRSGRRCPT